MRHQFINHDSSNYSLKHLQIMFLEYPICPKVLLNNLEKLFPFECCLLQIWLSLFIFSMCSNVCSLTHEYSTQIKLSLWKHSKEGRCNVWIHFPLITFCSIKRQGSFLFQVMYLLFKHSLLKGIFILCTSREFLCSSSLLQCISPKMQVILGEPKF